jgi:hypothetical protein
MALAVGRVQPVLHLGRRHGGAARLAPTQAKHLLVPPALLRVCIGFPGADARAAGGQRGALMGLAQPLLGGMALGHVEHHAVQDALAVVAADRRPGGQPAHPAIGANDAQVQLDQALAPAQQQREAVADTVAVVRVHLVQKVVGYRRCRRVARQAVQRAHLIVPMRHRRVGQLHAPHPHAGRRGGHLQALGQCQRVLLLVEALAQVERHADMADQIALGIAAGHPAGQQIAPMAVGMAPAGAQVDRCLGRMRAGLRVLGGGLTLHLLAQRGQVVGVNQRGQGGRLAAVRLRRQAQQRPAQVVAVHRAAGQVVLPDRDAGQADGQVELRGGVIEALRLLHRLGVVEQDAPHRGRLPVVAWPHLPDRAHRAVLAVGAAQPVAVGMAAQLPQRGLVAADHGRAVVGMHRAHQRLEAEAAVLGCLTKKWPDLRIPVAVAAAQVVAPDAEAAQRLRHRQQFSGRRQGGRLGAGRGVARCGRWWCWLQRHGVGRSLQLQAQDAQATGTALAQPAPQRRATGAVARQRQRCEGLVVRQLGRQRHPAGPVGGAGAGLGGGGGGGGSVRLQAQQLGDRLPLHRQGRRPDSGFKRGIGAQQPPARVGPGHRHVDQVEGGHWRHLGSGGRRCSIDAQQGHAGRGRVVGAARVAAAAKSKAMLNKSSRRRPPKTGLTAPRATCSVVAPTGPAGWLPRRPVQTRRDWAQAAERRGAARPCQACGAGPGAELAAQYRACRYHRP